MKQLGWEGVEWKRLVQNMGHRWILVDTVKDFLFKKGRETSLLSLQNDCSMGLGEKIK